MRIASVLALLGIVLLAGCLPDATPAPPPAASTAPAFQETTTVADSAPPDNTDAVQIITFAEQKHFRRFYDPLIARFNSQNPTVHVQFVPIDTLFETFTTYNDFIERLVRAADVVPLGWVNPLMFRQQLQQGFIQDIMPFASADPSFNRADFYPGMLEALTFDGKLAALPSNRSVAVVQYNKALWAKNTLPPPTASFSWPELRAAAAQIARKSDGAHAIYGYVDSYADNLLAIELASEGHDASFIPAAQVQLDRPEVTSALEQVAQLIKSNALYLLHTPLPGTDAEHTQITQLIHDQRVGIWGIGDAPVESLPFVVGTLPAPPDPLNNTLMQAYAISGGSQHPEAAWRWLAFLSANIPAPVASSNISVIPARQSIAARDGYWAQIDPEAAAVIKAALAQQPARIPPGDAPLFEMYRDEVFGTALRAVVKGSQSPVQAAAAAQTMLNQRLAAAAHATPAPTRPPLIVNTPVPEPTPQAAPITFGFTSFNDAALQQLVQRFEQQHPAIAVRLQALGSPEVRSLADSAATVDCFEHFYTPTAASSSALLDLQPLADADATFPRSDYPLALLTPFQGDGQLRGLPYAFDIPALHYQPDAFAAANLPLPGLHPSFPDLQAAAQQLTAGSSTQRRYGLALLGDMSAALVTLLQAQGVALTAPDGTPQLTTPEAQQAAQATVDLLRTTSPHEQLVAGEADAAAAALVTAGQVGMWLDTYGSFAADVLTATGTLAPLPGAPQPSITSSLYIAAHSTQPEACWSWLRFLSDQLPTWGYPARRSLAQSDAFGQQAPTGAAMVYAAAAPELEKHRTFTPTFNARWLTRALNQALHGKNLERELAAAQQATNMYQECIQGGTDSQSCAAQADTVASGS